MSEGLRKPWAAKGEAGGAEDEGSIKRDTHVQPPGENVKPMRRVSRRFVDIGVCNNRRDLTDKAVQVETVSGNMWILLGRWVPPYSVYYFHDIYCLFTLKNSSAPCIAVSVAVVYGVDDVGE